MNTAFIIDVSSSHTGVKTATTGSNTAGTGAGAGPGPGTGAGTMLHLVLRITLIF